MVDVGDLTDWEKMGISWATAHWEGVSYFRAPLSIRRLETLGLVETRISIGQMGKHEVKSELVRLTQAGEVMKAAIKASGFNIFGTIKRSA